MKTTLTTTGIALLATIVFSTSCSSARKADETTLLTRTKGGVIAYAGLSITFQKTEFDGHVRRSSIDSEQVYISTERMAIGGNGHFEEFEPKCLNDKFWICIRSSYLVADLPRQRFESGKTWVADGYEFRILDATSPIADESRTVVVSRVGLDEILFTYSWSPCLGLTSFSRHSRNENDTSLIFVTVSGRSGYGAPESCDMVGSTTN